MVVAIGYFSSEVSDGDHHSRFHVSYGRGGVSAQALPPAVMTPPSAVSTCAVIHSASAEAR
ncbi:hypothetical protein BI49514_02040 [Brevibacterium iodinum ATCC 49514]|uniref:Uncharacterized protein n=1 Tax=Brevibacterium iodinum ATCC 49514 TaxID=1255616 RepID=A0A2H1JIR1_9MICO|nr:hypothetical protein BI49514_02040 [Brevibacterium iodinum ATCC 49514]SUW14390.1 Uncharacterised protein [Brevibacterium iodinum]